MSGPTDIGVDSGAALFQIAEPGGEGVRSTTRVPGRAVGIDLGTTHSLVALAADGQSPRCLDLDGAGTSILPSVVAYLDDETVVGHAARSLAVTHPARVVSSVKRLMGRTAADLDFEHSYDVASAPDDPVVRLDLGDGRTVTPVEVSAELLRALALRARQALDIGPDEVLGAVITVPAYFDDAQRQATKDAGRVAGLDVYRLLAEPTAAALAYGLDRQSQGYFAVYDLGGGTFDISILRLERGVFQVLATGGDSALGGDDFDRALGRLVLGDLGHAFADLSPSQRQELLGSARVAKEELTTQEAVEVQVTGLGSTTITRLRFEEAIDEHVRRSIRACKRALKDAAVDHGDLDGVVLVGGSTRVPLVRRMVEKTFGQKPLADIDPDRVVALGAAIQADILSGSEREGVTLLDVVPLSLGLETMGGLVEKIVPRNATIPISARQVFTNYSEQQTGMDIHVVQGEREMAGDCRSLARFELQGIPQLPPSMARVEVTFELDPDALLTVTARELMTGVRQRVEVKPTYGLSADEVDQLVTDSLEHAREDFEARNRAEARVELGRVALAVRTALNEVGDREGMLGSDERRAIESALTASDERMAALDSDAEALDSVRKSLEKVSEGFARRRMERALQSGMSGKTLGEIEAALDEEDRLEERRGGHGPETIEPQESKA